MAEVVDSRFDVSLDAAPESGTGPDDLTGTWTRPRTGGLSVLPEETVTGSGRNNIGGVVPPDSPSYEIKGTDGTGGESA